MRAAAEPAAQRDRPAGEVEQAAAAATVRTLPKVVDPLAGRACPGRIELPTLLDEALQDRVGRAARSADTGPARTRALLGQPPAQSQLLLTARLIVTQAERLDLAIAVLFQVLGLGLLRLLVHGEIEPQGGKAVECAHHVFPMISEVTERTVQDSGSSWLTSQGGCRKPRRQPEARTGASPVNGMPFAASANARRPAPVSARIPPVSSRRKTIRTGRYGRSRLVPAPSGTTSGSGSSVWT